MTSPTSPSHTNTNTAVTVAAPPPLPPKCTDLIDLDAKLQSLHLPSSSSSSSITDDLSPRSLSVSPHKQSTSSSLCPTSLSLSCAPSPITPLPTATPTPRKPADTPLSTVTTQTPPHPPPTAGLSDAALRAVVKLYVTHCEPKYIRPWQMGAQTYTTASGFLLPGRRVLTNAHAVEHHTLVRVKRRDSDRRFLAKVLAQSDECDLALLSVPEDEFWESIESDPSTAPATDNHPGCPPSSAALTLGDADKLPALRDSVVVVGYPHGGDGISVTAGVVSRVELLDYSAAATLLSVQIDAAINPGNSGGPAFDAEGKVVGVAFRVMTGDSSENIGYLIPIPVVRHFLDGAERTPQQTGFPELGFDFLDLEAPAMRRHLGLPKSESGVLVRAVPPCSPARGVLKTGDIVTHIDRTPVSNAGMVRHAASQERMALQVVIADKFIGDTVTLRVFRKDEKDTSDEGTFMHVSYSLPDLNETRLIPVHLPPRYTPQYFVFGGLVFTALSGPYLRSAYGNGPMADSRTPTQIRWLWEYGEKTHGDQEVVVLSHVLNAQLNIHYEHLYDERVQRVNDTPVRNLRHLVQLVTEKAKNSEFVTFDLLEEKVVMDRAEAVAENQSILDMHHIAKGCSFDPDSVRKFECAPAPAPETETKQQGQND